MLTLGQPEKAAMSYCCTICSVQHCFSLHHQGVALHAGCWPGMSGSPVLTAACGGPCLACDQQTALQLDAEGGWL